MKKALIPGLMAILLLSACSSATGSVTQDDAMKPNDDAAATDEATPPTDADTVDVTVDANAAVGTHIVEMTATSWVFTPATVTAKQGETVVIRLTGNEGMHSFMSKDLGINVEINPGETKDITIPTDKAGTFSFRCGVPCGPGHKEMTGTIVIEA